MTSSKVYSSWIWWHSPVSTPKSWIVPSVYPTASVFPSGLQVMHEKVRFPISSSVSVKLRCQPIVLATVHSPQKILDVIVASAPDRIWTWYEYIWNKISRFMVAPLSNCGATWSRTTQSRSLLLCLSSKFHGVTVLCIPKFYMLSTAVTAWTRRIAPEQIYRKTRSESSRTCGPRAGHQHEVMRPSPSWGTWTPHDNVLFFHGAQKSFDSPSPWQRGYLIHSKETLVVLRARLRDTCL